MNSNVKFILDLAAVFVPVGIAMVVAIWRSSVKLRENTAAVSRLASAIDGTVIEAGLSKRVRELEDWRLEQDTRHRVAKENES